MDGLRPREWRIEFYCQVTSGVRLSPEATVACSCHQLIRYYTFDAPLFANVITLSAPFVHKLQLRIAASNRDDMNCQRMSKYSMSQIIPFFGAFTLHLGASCRTALSCTVLSTSAPTWPTFSILQSVNWSRWPSDEGQVRRGYWHSLSTWFPQERAHFRLFSLSFTVRLGEFCLICILAEFSHGDARLIVSYVP